MGHMSSSQTIYADPLSVLLYSLLLSILYLYRDSSVYMAAKDANKAFDSVYQYSLFLALLKYIMFHTFIALSESNLYGHAFAFKW